MIRTGVGYSIDSDSFLSGQETAKIATNNLKSVQLNFLYTSVKNNVEEVVKGVQSITRTAIIGCTSSGGIMVPDGIIESKNGFSGMMSIHDDKMTVGLACHEAGKNPREIGRKVAYEAVQNSKTSRAPVGFYMVASKKNEEEYLMGIQDIIGRVPMFGGTTSDEFGTGTARIICGNKILKSGVAVAFIYTDTEIETVFTGNYRETSNMGMITETLNSYEISKINGISALKQYAIWIEEKSSAIMKEKLRETSILKPLGIKNPTGNILIVKHPLYGNNKDTKSTNDDTIMVGSKVVEGTGVIALAITEDEIVDSTTETIKNLKKKMYVKPSGYIFFHNEDRKKVIGDRLDELHKQILKETKSTPFIVVFTNGEYGYNEHSENTCGELMLSFTAFGEE